MKHQYKTLEELRKASEGFLKRWLNGALSEIDINKDELTITTEI